LAHEHRVEDPVLLVGEVILRRTPILSFDGMSTAPWSESSSPAMTLISVDLPAPFAPTSTYRLPGSNRIETFSKRIFGPNAW